MQDKRIDKRAHIIIVLIYRTHLCVLRSVKTMGEIADDCCQSCKFDKMQKSLESIISKLASIDEWIKTIREEIPGDCISEVDSVGITLERIEKIMLEKRKKQIGSRYEVASGKAISTSGGMQKDDMLHKADGTVISRKGSFQSQMTRALGKIEGTSDLKVKSFIKVNDQIITPYIQLKNIEYGGDITIKILIDFLGLDIDLFMEGGYGMFDNFPKDIVKIRRLFGHNPTIPILDYSMNSCMTRSESIPGKQYEDKKRIYMLSKCCVDEFEKYFGGVSDFSPSDARFFTGYIGNDATRLSPFGAHFFNLMIQLNQSLEIPMMWFRDIIKIPEGEELKAIFWRLRTLYVK